MNTSTASLPPDDDLNTLAGEYVLGVLDAGGRHEVAQRLPHDPALRAAVAQWEDRFVPLVALAPPQEPSAGLWERINRSLGTASRAAPAAARAPARTAAAPSWWQRLGLWQGLTAAGFAAALVMAVVLTMQIAPPAAERYMVVLATPQGSQPGWVVQSAASGEITLTPLGTTEVPERKALQFWTKGDGWTAPVSLGLVQPGQAVTVRLDALPPLQANQLFEITLEPENGSPTGRPTGPILYIGRAVKMT